MPNLLPILNPEEHAFLERVTKRSLSNDEAQELLKCAILEAAFNAWADGKETPNA